MKPIRVKIRLRGQPLPGAERATAAFSGAGRRLLRGLCCLLIALAVPLAVRGQEAPGPAASGGDSPALVRGLRFGLGFPVLKVRSDRLNRPVEGGALSDTGVMLNVDLLQGGFRFGYARHLYRRTLPGGTLFEGQPVDTLAFDADQLWVFHGWNAAESVYLGYGLGAQRRRTRVLEQGATVAEDTESGFLLGLGLEWVMAGPFLLNLRLFGDLGDGFITQQGASLQLTFHSDF